MGLRIINKFIIIILIATVRFAGVAQEILPPVLPWNGKSEALIVGADHPWVTHCELSDFVTTPKYDETMAWFQKLCKSSKLLDMVSIGKSVEGRDIYMIIASTEKKKSIANLKKNGKPTLLVQAGIHSGEIDGKDAGMMLLRDIAFGGKKSLLEGVNFLFVPILNVDGHERTSPYNRVNQRGPANMGWRTNAQNLNLNRDYGKLDTKEVQAIVKVIQAYDPLLYMDIHVTDGADYQYDITFGGAGPGGYSPGITEWLELEYKVKVDEDLRSMGHIPGPLMFAVNDIDFTKGNIFSDGGPRFSDSYGKLRHTATVLVENHSLKPYKQRVLGTYVMLEASLEMLGKKSSSLKDKTEMDRAMRINPVPLSWKVPQLEGEINSKFGPDAAKENTKSPTPDSLLLLGISSKMQHSDITNALFIEWLGKAETSKIVYYKATEPSNFVSRPKGYWIPASCPDVIERLRMHGVIVEEITQAREVQVEMYRISNAKFGNGGNKVMPNEGHIEVSGTTTSESRMQVFPPGSVYISTDQRLGDLVVVLLEPTSKDSYFSWGFFLPIFQRTEYIESYVMEPLAKKMLEDSPSLRKEFEDKKAADKAFADSPNAILSWFYSKTKYYDDRYLLYPIGRQM